MLVAKRRKGDPTDIPFFLVVVFFLAVSFLVVLFVNDILNNDVIGGTDLGNTTASTSIQNAFSSVNTEIAQTGFIIFFAFLIVGVVVSSFLIRVHPVFLIIYVITLAVAIFTAIFLGNVFHELTENDKLSAIADQNTMITFIMNNIVVITLAVGALSMLIIFAKIVGGKGGVATPASAVDI